MKLYLSSYGLGNQPQRLAQLVGENKLGAIIVNAQDLATKVERKERVIKGIEELESIGLRGEELDLRNYFGNHSKLKEDLSKYGLVWIRGGNAFVLRRAMKQSGFDEIVSKLVREDKLVYAGFSAGAAVVTPTLKGIEHVDDTDGVPDGYNKPVVWEGLSLYNYSIAPHYRSDHPESLDIDRVVEYLKENNLPYRALRDGEVIVLDGKKEELIR